MWSAAGDCAVRAFCYATRLQPGYPIKLQLLECWLQTYAAAQSSNIWSLKMQPAAKSWHERKPMTVARAVAIASTFSIDFSFLTPVCSSSSPPGTLSGVCGIHQHARLTCIRPHNETIRTCTNAHNFSYADLQYITGPSTARIPLMACDSIDCMCCMQVHTHWGMPHAVCMVLELY